MRADEAQLVAAVRAEDPTAARQLIDRFYAPLYAFLRRLAGNEADAADLTQKTFSRVWAALPRFAGRSSLGSWLHGIAHHVYLDWRRADHRLETRPDEWWETCPDPAASPATQVAAADLAAAVYRAVDRLETDTRLTVHLHYYQGLTIEETAAALGIAGSTVKYRLRTALEHLQGQFDDTRLIPTPVETLHRP